MTKVMKTALITLILFAFVASSASAAKNVIMMVPDGCSGSIQTLARWVKGGPLNLDSLTSGSVITWMADSIIPDSASQATAFSTGHKTSDKFLGVGPRSDTLLKGFEATAAPYEPLQTILEAAKLNGKATGLVATSVIPHATPAAFACHIPDRSKYDEIMEQIVYQDIDVVFGGGKRHLIPLADGGARTDGENLLKVLADRGYQFVETAQEMADARNAKIWGMFADGDMDPDLDRDDLNPAQPSLAQMTAKAIDVLKKNDEGFFLLVEGSQVDWAGHANDAAFMVYDFLAFDEAVGVAYKFAKKDDDTLLLIFPDHNTGALSIGHTQSTFPPSYTKTKIEHLVDPIKDATMTIQGLLYEVPGVSDTPRNVTPTDVKNTFVTYHGPYWSKMTDDQAKYIADTLTASGAYNGYYPIAEYVSKNLTIFGWTSHGHTGEDVPLWSYGPERPVGTLDNTKLATIAADAFGLKLRGSKAWKEYDDSILDLTDPANPVAKVGPWSYPVSKDLRIHENGTIEYFSDITVHAPNIKKVYLPKH